MQPSSPQVQFLASSASLEENQQSIDFLSEFFGIEKDEFRKKFKIISNPPQQSVEKPNIILPIDELKKYGSGYEEDANADNNLLKILGCDNFYELSIKYQLLSWLKYALSSNKGIIAKDIQKIADRLGLSGEERLSVVAGLIKALCKSEKNGQYLAPLRAHFFFRNISGLWGCSDPNCPCIRNEYKFSGRTIGTLYKRPRNVCTCGMKVLEVLVCENCGEIYLGGYRVAVNNHTYLSSEKPVNDKECGYCILWNGNASPEDGWKRVSFNPSTGEYHLDMDGKYSLYEQPSDSEIKFPHKCPQCEVAYYIKDKNSVTPIRYHGTGLQKVNQVLADSLIRSMKNAKENNTKVVLFSDSRQSAAKLSAGIELGHFRDVLRWAILHALNGSNEVVSF